MHKHLIVLVVFFAIFSRSEVTPAQANLTSATPRGDAILEGNGSTTSNKTEARSKSQDVSKRAREEAKRFYKLGVKYGRGGLFRQASELFQKAVELNPNYGDAHYGLGLALFDQGLWEDAIRSFKNALKINPKDKDARARLDEASMRAGRSAKSAQLSEEEKTPVNGLAPNASSDSAPKNGTPAAVPVSLNVSTDSPTNDSTSASPARNDLTRVYHIGIGDILDVRLGDEPATQSTLFTVTPSGLLEHPILAQPLQVSGLTVEETRARLEADLKRRAVNDNPRVLVGVREYLSHAIIVSGLVKEPGTKILRREAIPLYVVIADAQPLPDAGRATLIRHETGDAVVVDLAKPAEMNLLVRSGDVITILANPKQFFYVGGEVKAPGEKEFRPGLTLTQAILAAGGLSREAKAAHIAREGDKGFLASTRYKLKDINRGKLADPLIQPGDRITIER
jgi:protein involved in polysaccharide export with SLBB domain